MTDQTATVPVTADEQIEALQEFGMGDLRTLADRIGAPNARSKAELAANIVARADHQGLGYTGYTAALSAPISEPVETTDAAGPVTKKAPSVPVSSQENGNESLFDPYSTRVKHFMFTIGEVLDPAIGLVDGPTADDEIGRFLQSGYDPVKTFVAGFDTRGQRVGWVLEKTDKPIYTEVKHVMRTLVGQPNPGRGLITGFQADAYVGDLLDQGWELLNVVFNGIDTGPVGSAGGIYMIWFLAR